MGDEKRKDLADYQAETWKKDFAPGVAGMLRELCDLNEAATLDLLKKHGDAPDFEKRLSVVLSSNLSKMVQELYELPDLLAFSLRSVREVATTPKKEGAR